MGDACDAARRGVRSNPCKFVLDVIMQACMKTGEEGLAIQLDKNMVPPFDDEKSEIRFLEWIVEMFQKRTTWPVGKWVSTVLEESLIKATEVFLLE